MSPHHWRTKECKYCSNWSLEKISLELPILNPSILKDEKERIK